MGANKVILGTTVLVDLTEDSVTPETLVVGSTAHDKSGAQINGENPYKKAETDETVAEQADLLEEIKAVLETKAAGEAVIVPLEVTANGTYQPADGVSGYSPVTVNVPTGGDTSVEDLLVEGALTTYSNPRVKYVGSHAFRSTSLQSVDLSAATYLGEYAFYECRALESANLPSVEYVGPYCFYRCPFEMLRLPSCEQIVAGAFQRCSDLIALILSGEVVCYLTKINAFDYTQIKDGTGYIYVPRTLVDSYKTDSEWSTYAAQIRALEDYTVDGTTTGALDESKI